MTDPQPDPDSTPPADPAQPPAPEPDTGDGKDLAADAEKWKALARRHEQRAKENADAAKRLQQLEDAQKSEQQRLEDRATAAERDRDRLQAEALRYKIAAQHGISGEDMDLLEGVADEDKLTARAERIAALRAAAQQQQPAAPRQPTPGRPVEQLKPGATPQDHQSEDEQVWNQLFGSPTP